MMTMKNYANAVWEMLNRHKSCSLETLNFFFSLHYDNNSSLNPTHLHSNFNYSPNIWSAYNERRLLWSKTKLNLWKVNLSIGLREHQVLITWWWGKKKSRREWVQTPCRNDTHKFYNSSARSTHIEFFFTSLSFKKRKIFFNSAVALFLVKSFNCDRISSAP